MNYFFSTYPIEAEPAIPPISNMVENIPAFAFEYFNFDI